MRPTDTAIPMPIGLNLADVAGLATFGLGVFVVAESGPAADSIISALAATEGVTVPAQPANLFGAGLDRVLHNYLAGMHVGYGMSALSDETTYLLAVRGLADDVYGAVRGSPGDVMVDASASNTPLAHVIQAVYPDALFVVVDPPRGPAPAPLLLTGPRVVRLTAAEVANAESLRATLTAAIAAARVGAAPAAAPVPTTLPGPPVFIVGCPRSGTTWLQNMLSAHPATGGPRHETAMFSSVRGLIDNPGLRAWISPEDLLAALRRFTEGLFAHCLRERAPNATRLIEKTPHHALHLDLIATLYPEASIIGIHRDGRDVVRSLLEIEFGTESAAVAARGWLRSTRAVQDFATHFRLTRDERYEALLEDPVVGVTDVLRWLELPPDDAVVDELRSRAGARVSQHGTTGDVGSGKWRDIAPADLRTIYRVAGPQLVALGYMTPGELATVKRDPAYVAAAAADRLTALAKRTARFLRAMRPR